MFVLAMIILGWLVWLTHGQRYSRTWHPITLLELQGSAPPSSGSACPVWRTAYEQWSKVLELLGSQSKEFDYLELRTLESVVIHKAGVSHLVSNRIKGLPKAVEFCPTRNWGTSALC